MAKQTDFSGGMANNLNVNLAPPNTVDLLLNLDADEEIGSATSRLGTAIVGSQLVDNMSVLGLHQHIDVANSSNNKLFAAINAAGGASSVVYDVIAGTTSKTGLTASKKMRFLTYLGHTLMINGTDAEMVYNNNAIVTSATFTGAVNDTITSVGHGLLDGDTIQLTTSNTLPAGLATGTTYYVRDRATDTFKVALTLGGSAVDITDTGTGTHTWNFLGSFDLYNMPGSNSCELVTEFLSRVYLAGDSTYPTRLYYSGVPVNDAVSWSVGNGYVDIEPEDNGGPLTALGKVPGYILAFKERSMHRWNFNSAFPESLIQIGTPSQESVVMGNGLCAFYSNSNESAKGFYITNGDRPVPISHDNNRPIKKWVDAIPSANDANIAGWATDRGFAWSVGDLTVDGETYTNVVLRYNRILNQWSVRTYPTEHKVYAQYLVSGVNTIVAGDDDGTVYRIDKAGTYSDALLSATQPIQYRLRQQSLTYQTNKIKKVSDRVIVRGENIEGITGYVVPDTKTVNRKGIGPSTIRGPLAILPVGSEIEGTTLAVELLGETLNARAYIREIDIPKLTPNENYD